MYFVFDVYIDILTYVTSSGILFDGLASLVLSTFNSVTLCGAPHPFACENMQSSVIK